MIFINKVLKFKSKIYFFVSDFKKRWLETSISFPNYSTGGTRIVESSDRAKCQKTESLRTKHSPEELSFAAQMSLHSSGQIEASKVVKKVNATTPSRATKYRSAYKTFNSTQMRQLTPVSWNKANVGV